MEARTLTVCWNRWPIEPADPFGWCLMEEKSGHGGPPVAMTMIGLSWSTLSMMASTKVSILKVVMSPMCIGVKCSSRTAMHSASISQLMVSTGCIPRWRKAKLAAPIPSKKLRCTTDVSWNSLRDSCWMRFCPPDPVTSVVRPDGQLLFFVGSAPGSCPGPCCP